MQKQLRTISILLVGTNLLCTEARAQWQGASGSTDYTSTLYRSGSVGIGTSSPPSGIILQIDPTSANNYQLYFGGTAAGNTGLSIKATSYSGGSVYLQGVKSSGSAWGHLLLNPYSGNSTTGYVGIGVPVTSSPQSMLHVSGGDIRADGQIWITGTGGASTGLEFGSRTSYADQNAARINVNTTNSVETLDIWGAGNSWDKRRVRIFSEGGMLIGGKVNIQNLNGDNTDPFSIEQINTASNKSEFRISLGDDLGTADDFLSVGVYSTTNAGAWKNFLTLNTLGELRVKKYIVTQTGWADDEFFETIKMPSLKEEEAVTKAEHHLIGVPSENEIAGKGLDLGEMQAIQMRKIEQLYKHLFVLSKENEELKAEIGELKKLVRK